MNTWIHHTGQSPWEPVQPLGRNATNPSISTLCHPHSTCSNGLCLPRLLCSILPNAVGWASRKYRSTARATGSQGGKLYPRKSSTNGASAKPVVSCRAPDVQKRSRSHSSTRMSPCPPPPAPDTTVCSTRYHEQRARENRIRRGPNAT